MPANIKAIALTAALACACSPAFAVQAPAGTALWPITITTPAVNGIPISEGGTTLITSNPSADGSATITVTVGKSSSVAFLALNGYACVAEKVDQPSLYTMTDTQVAAWVAQVNTVNDPTHCYPGAVGVGRGVGGVWTLSQGVFSWTVTIPKSDIAQDGSVTLTFLSTSKDTNRDVAPAPGYETVNEANGLPANYKIVLTGASQTPGSVTANSSGNLYNRSLDFTFVPPMRDYGKTASIWIADLDGAGCSFSILQPDRLFGAALPCDSLGSSIPSPSASGVTLTESVSVPALSAANVRNRAGHQVYLCYSTANPVTLQSIGCFYGSEFVETADDIASDTQAQNVAAYVADLNHGPALTFFDVLLGKDRTFAPGTTAVANYPGYSVTVDFIPLQNGISVGMRESYTYNGVPTALAVTYKLEAAGEWSLFDVVAYQNGTPLPPQENKGLFGPNGAKLNIGDIALKPI